MGLLDVSKQKIDTPKGGNGDERDRVRNIYRLLNPAAFPPRALALNKALMEARPGGDVLFKMPFAGD